MLPAEQELPDIATKRARWRRHHGKSDSSRLVFIDETWAKTNMTRTHGRYRRDRRDDTASAPPQSGLANNG
ncbi:hypothetical protein [Acidocella sp.]|uniref:hypothetical protein n=1 Tax=Acidocella sp. TaxID=50710 RepID=UPI0038D095AA